MRMRFPRIPSASAASIVLVTATLGMFSGSANATPAFARSTGAACSKCHSEIFPRLNERGERFMRNGFQVRGEEGVSLDAPGKGKDDSKDEGKQVASDLYLNNMSNLLSVYGVVDALSKSTDSKAVTVGSPQTLSLLATGTLAKDMPVFMEMELDAQSGAVEADRFFVGMTNLGGSSSANVRVGSLDPTEWTSFPSLAAEAFKAKTDHVGVYSGADAGKDGFAAVGTGLTPRHAIEYYGYTNNVLWAAAVGNPPAEDTAPAQDKRNLDFWAVARYDIAKTGSVSLLYYDSNSPEADTRVFTLAGNLRLPVVDLLAQYSRDSGTDDRSKVQGFTLQANVPFVKHIMGLARYDMTDNGADGDSKEAVFSLGTVYTPVQNFKITAAITNELSHALNGDPEQAAKSNGFNVNFHYAL